MRHCRIKKGKETRSFLIRSPFDTYPSQTSNNQDFTIREMILCGKIVDEEYFLLSDGTKYKLSECEFERYNFKFKDENGRWKTHKKRERIEKICLLADNIET